MINRLSQTRLVTAFRQWFLCKLSLIFTLSWYFTRITQIKWISERQLIKEDFNNWFFWHMFYNLSSLRWRQIKEHAITLWRYVYRWLTIALQLSIINRLFIDLGKTLISYALKKKMVQKWKPEKDIHELEQYLSQQSSSYLHMECNTASSSMD